jgi:hypothetical protein
MKRYIFDTNQKNCFRAWDCDDLNLFLTSQNNLQKRQYDCMNVIIQWLVGSKRYIKIMLMMEWGSIIYNVVFGLLYLHVAGLMSIVVAHTVDSEQKLIMTWFLSSMYHWIWKLHAIQNYQEAYNCMLVCCNILFLKMHSCRSEGNW